MEIEKAKRHSFIVHWFSEFVDWGNKWLTLSHWLFRSGEYMFLKIEVLMLFLTAFCVTLPFWVQWIPSNLRFLFYLFTVQRIAEFVIVYSRNFIFKRGRIYDYNQRDLNRGAWLILMFSLSVMQVMLVFSAWFRLISLDDPEAYTEVLDGLTSIYFTMDSFLTVGYGDIAPMKHYSRLLMIMHQCLTYFVLVVVVNGLISTHFGDHSLASGHKPEEPK